LQEVQDWWILRTQVLVSMPTFPAVTSSTLSNRRFGSRPRLSAWLRILAMWPGPALQDAKANSARLAGLK
jgi:hypothetical protein